LLDCRRLAGVIGNLGLDYRDDMIFRPIETFVDPATDAFTTSVTTRYSAPRTRLRRYWLMTDVTPL
jgi:hypothetical protein